jgi:hypothetical protein
MRAAFIILAIVALLPACKKYDEGPSVSLLSKKARLTGEWEVARFYLNEEQIQLTNKEEMTVNKNGTLSKSTLIGTNTYNSDGNWAFSDDKLSLLVTYSATSSETWSIKKLSNKQLFVEITQPNGSVARYEYVKKTK